MSLRSRIGIVLGTGRCVERRRGEARPVVAPYRASGVGDGDALSEGPPVSTVGDALSDVPPVSGVGEDDVTGCGDDVNEGPGDGDASGGFVGAPTLEVPGLVDCVSPATPGEPPLVHATPTVIRSTITKSPLGLLTARVYSSRPSHLGRLALTNAVPATS